MPNFEGYLISLNYVVMLGRSEIESKLLKLAHRNHSITHTSPSSVQSIF